MFKVEIKKDNVITNYSEFKTQELAQAWVDQESSNLSFGKVHREVAEIQTIDMDGSVTILLNDNEDITKSVSVREELDMMGNTIRFHTLPADFAVVITDVTAVYLAKKESADALQYLKDTDYLILRQIDSGVECPAEIKALRAAARLKVL